MTFELFNSECVTFRSFSFDSHEIALLFDFQLHVKILCRAVIPQCSLFHLDNSFK